MNAFYWLLTLMLLGFGSDGREARQPQVANPDATVIQRQDVSRVEPKTDVKRSSGLAAKGIIRNHNETLMRDTNA